MSHHMGNKMPNGWQRADKRYSLVLLKRVTR